MNIFKKIWNTVSALAVSFLQDDEEEAMNPEADNALELRQQESVQLQVSDPIVNEIAGSIGFDLERFQFLMRTHDPNPIYKNPKFTGLHLFQEMDTDSRIFNTMTILKDGIRMRESWIRPPDKSEEQAKRTAFVVMNLKRIPDLKQKKKEIMACLDFGYSVVEKIISRQNVVVEYEFEGQKKSFQMKGAWMIDDLKARPVTAFTFDEKNRCIFSGNQKNVGGFIFQSPENQRPLTEEEEAKFMITTHDPRFGYRAGWSIKVAMFPPYLCKRAAKTWRLIFVNRYGMPIPHGKYKPGTKPEGAGGTNEFKKRLAGLQTAAYVMTPEGFAIDFLKAMQTGDLDPYQNLLDYSDYEISEAGLGHREATAQAGTGSYASEVLKSTALRQERLEANCSLLDTAFNDQFIVPLLNINFPPIGIYPKQQTDSSAMRDHSATISQYETGHSMGIPLKLSQIYRDMSWEKPEDPEDTLPGNTSHVFPDRSDRDENQI